MKTSIRLYNQKHVACVLHAGALILHCDNVCTRWHYGTYYATPIDNFHFGGDGRVMLTQVMITNCLFIPD